MPGGHDRTTPFAITSNLLCRIWPRGALSLAISALMLLLSFTPAVANTTDEPNPTELDQYSAQLAIGEYRQALDGVTQLISGLKAKLGTVDIQLAEPYLLLGDIHLELDAPEQALVAYDTALHIFRVHHGLNSTAQINLMYRVSNAFVDLNDYQNANEYQERAYALMLDQVGPDDPELLPSLLKLIDWYESNRRYRAAKILYIHANKLAHSLYPPHDKRHVDLARAFAKAMRNTSYPPMNMNNRFRAFDVQIPGFEPPNPYNQPPSSYSLGYRALERVVGYIEEYEDADLQKLTTAKLNLADWYQLYGRETQAIRLYREIWHDLDELPNHRNQIFDEPKLLYIRLPELEEEVTESGLVELLLTISTRGIVTGRISQIVQPPDRSIEFSTRVAAREARFRPAIRDGKPVKTKGFLLTHRYPLSIKM